VFKAAAVDGGAASTGAGAGAGVGAGAGADLAALVANVRDMTVTSTTVPTTHKTSPKAMGAKIKNSSRSSSDENENSMVLDFETHLCL
jgi:hypothetical protein